MGMFPSLRFDKVATPPCAAYAAIPCGLAVRKQHEMPVSYTHLEVLSGLEIDGVSQIFTLFKKVADGGRTPAVHIFESLILSF